MRFDDVADNMCWSHVIGCHFSSRNQGSKCISDTRQYFLVPIARLAGGAMDNTVDQSVLGEHAGEFMVCHNRPENDAEWEDEEKVGTASMAGPDPEAEGGLPGHVFITCKDVRWDRFNVLVMGMEGTREGGGGGGVHGGDAWQILQRLEAAAEHYVEARGWDSDRAGRAGPPVPFSPQLKPVSAAYKTLKTLI